MGSNIKKIHSFSFIILIIVICSNVTVSKVEAKTKIGLNKTILKIQKGKQRRIKFLGKKKNVTWKSKNRNIAIVNKNGRVKGVKVGKTKIIAKDGKKKYVCKVEVKKIYLANWGEAASYVRKIYDKNDSDPNLVIRYHRSPECELENKPKWIKNSFLLQGYDDMETHTATLFWYHVSRDGKIYDHMFGRYIKK